MIKQATKALRSAEYTGSEKPEPCKQQTIRVETDDPFACKVLSGRMRAMNRHGIIERLAKQDY
jgi:hypothetical protein